MWEGIYRWALIGRVGAHIGKDVHTCGGRDMVRNLEQFWRGNLGTYGQWGLHRWKEGKW
jgi:hypothetical protein